DIGLMPQIAELLGVSVDELLTGKEPEPRIVEKVVIKEKEVAKHIPARKILAIVAPIVLVVVLASALLGVYIPKAIAANTPPIIETPEPEPEIVYYEVSALARDNSAQEITSTFSSRYNAPLQNDVAYYSFTPEFNSDYTFYFVAPYYAKIKIDDNDYVVIKESDEMIDVVDGEISICRKYKYSAYMTKGSVHYIEIDMSDCCEGYVNTWSSSLCICQKFGYDDVTVRAGSDYTFWVKQDKQSYRELKYYKLLNNDLYFVSWDTIYRKTLPDDVVPYEGYPRWRIDYISNSGGHQIDCDADDVGVIGLQFMDEYIIDTLSNGEIGYACTVHNYSDKDIVLSIAEPEVETISLDTMFAYKSQSTPKSQYFKVSALAPNGYTYYPNIYLYVNKSKTNNTRLYLYRPFYDDVLRPSEYSPIWSNDEWMCFYMQDVSSISYLHLLQKYSEQNGYEIELFFSASNPYKLFEQDKPEENEYSE
ncbi:MAG: hypothetical protein K2M36_02325, partial [Clostridia bacterium]|nr:hypothetical protein [Clostridia bacterium]